MNSTQVNTALMRYLVGPVSEKKRSLSKGVALGFLIFVLFEFLSLINPNIPYVPSSWLVAVTIWTAQISLFIKIARFLRHPRKEDFFFVIAFDNSRRIDLAQKSLTSVHNTIILFVYSSLAVIVPLQFFIIKERSVLNLIAVPVVVIAFTWLLFIISKTLLRKGFIRPSAKDERLSSVSFLSKGMFSRFFSSLVIKMSKSAGQLVPVKIRPFVIRNFMYLLRSDPLQIPLISIAAPLLICLFLLLVGDRNSPFMEFLPLLTVFILNSYYSFHLQDATVKLQECPYYQYSPKKMLMAHLFTIIIVSMPYMLIFSIALNIHIISISGALRFLTFLTAFTATLFINCRAVLHPQRKDSESATDFLLFFLTVAPGVFIPVFGWIFPLFSIASTILLEWESIFGDIRTGYD